MRKVKKIVSIGIFICLMLLCNIVSADNSYNIEQYDIHATILENGNVHVVEDLVYHFEEDMNGVLRQLIYRYEYKGQKDDANPTSIRYQAQDIVNLKVWTSNVKGENHLKESVPVLTASNGQEGVYVPYGIDESGKKGYEIKVYSPVQSRHKKYVRYEYDIKDVCVKYQDMGELYYNFIGADWQCNMDNANIIIDFENPVEIGKVQVYPHTYAKGLSSVNKQENSISFSVSPLSSNTAVDARVVFPKGAVTSSDKVYHESYEAQEIEKIEEKMQQDKKNYQISYQLYGILAVVAMIALIIFIFLVKKEMKDKDISAKKVEYNRDLPKGYSLGEENSILLGKAGYQDPNLFIATVLDLVNRKVLKMDSMKKQKKSVFDSIEYRYELSLGEKAKTEKTSLYDNLVLNILFEKKVKDELEIDSLVGKKIELNEALKEFGKKRSQQTTYHKLVSYGNKADKEFYQNEKSPLKRYFILTTMILVVLFFVNFLIINPLNVKAKSVDLVLGVGFLAFYFILGYSIISSLFHHVKEEYLEEKKKLLGLKKYLTEYSLMKDKYPIEIALWDKYLVYASLFGIADKIAKEIQEELIKQGYEEEAIFTTYPILCVSHYSTSINHSISSYTGSSSGGYSGGGSGGGRRRRPEVVEPFRSNDISWIESNKCLLLLAKKLIMKGIFIDRFLQMRYTSNSIVEKGFLNMQIITSKDNEIVKHIRKLKEKKYRDQNKEFIIEGIKLVEEAISEKVPIKKIVICEECITDGSLDSKLLYEIAKYDCIYVAKKIFRLMSDVTNPQGILAVVENTDNKEKINYTEDVVIVLEDIQDPGNLGTILRTVDSSGLSQIIVTVGTADAYNPKVVRSTMGAIFRVNIIITDNILETLKDFQKHKYEVLATSLEQSESIYETNYTKKIIVIGNESNGVSSSVLKLADKRIKIPMLGKTESLNAAVATSIIVYEYVRQKMKK